MDETETIEKENDAINATLKAIGYKTKRDDREIRDIVDKAMGSRKGIQGFRRTLTSMPEYEKLKQIKQKAIKIQAKFRGNQERKRVQKLLNYCGNALDTVRKDLNSLNAMGVFKQLENIREKISQIRSDCKEFNKKQLEKQLLPLEEKLWEMKGYYETCEKELNQLQSKFNEIQNFYSSNPGTEKQAKEKLKSLQDALLDLRTRCPEFQQLVQKGLKEVQDQLQKINRVLKNERRQEKTKKKRNIMIRKQKCIQLFQKQDMTRFSNINQFRKYEKYLRKAKRGCKDKTLKQEIDMELRKWNKALKAFNNLINSMCEKVGNEIDAEIMKFSQLSEIEQISQAGTLLLKIKSLMKGCKDLKKVKVFQDIEKELKNQRENACNTVGRELEIKLKNLKYEKGNKDKQILIKMQQLKKLREEAKLYAEACGEAPGTYNFNMLVNEIGAAIKILDKKFATLAESKRIEVRDDPKVDKSTWSYGPYAKRMKNDVAKEAVGEANRRKKEKEKLEALMRKRQMEAERKRITEEKAQKEAEKKRKEEEERQLQAMIAAEKKRKEEEESRKAEVERVAKIAAEKKRKEEEERRKADAERVAKIAAEREAKEAQRKRMEEEAAKEEQKRKEEERQRVATINEDTALNFLPVEDNEEVARKIAEVAKDYPLCVFFDGDKRDVTNTNVYKDTLKALQLGGNFLFHDGPEGIILIEENMSVAKFFDKGKDEEYIDNKREFLKGFRDTRSKRKTMMYTEESNVTCLHWVIKKKKYGKSSYLYERLLKHIGETTYLFYQLGCDVDANKDFYENKGANILMLYYQKGKTPDPNLFRFAYQRGDSNGSFVEFMKELNTENAGSGSDNNNNRPKRKLKNAIKLTSGMKKAAKDRKMIRKKDDAVYAIGPENAIRNAIKKLAKKKDPKWQTIKSVLDMLVRNDNTARQYVAEKYKKKLKFYTNKAGDLSVEKKDEAMWKKTNNDGKSPTEQWWDILNDVLDKLNTLPSSADWFGLGYRLPEFPKKLFEELSLDLEHIWDYAEDTSVPEPMTFGLAARKAKQFNVFE
ncbi:MAG: hypothetical protein CBC48_11890 [bacterium TMED88]|nr:MAG: hypothetical protein CBC48_11890 [bacterium TMED88]